MNNSDALEVYHRQFRNETYLQAQDLILKELFPKSEEDKENLLKQDLPHQLLNLLTDSALEFCGYSHPQKKSLILIRVLLDAKLSPNVFAACAEHLKHFGNAEEWLAISLCLYQERQSHHLLINAIQHGSSIHGAVGNAAYDFLCSAAAMQAAAAAVLQADKEISLQQVRTGLERCRYAFSRFEAEDLKGTGLSLSETWLDDEKMQTISLKKGK